MELKPNSRERYASACCVLRNRWHFGAQIVTIPALFYIKKHLLSDNGSLTLISKQKSEWFYHQFPWVDHYKLQRGIADDLRLIRRSGLLVSLRTRSYRFLVLSLLARCKARFGLSRGSWADCGWTDQILFDDSVYRGMHYLKLVTVRHKLSDADLLQLLRLPFAQLSEESEICLSEGGDSLTVHICIMPGGGAGSFKKWGVSNYYAVVKMISQHLKRTCAVHWVLGPDETEELHQIDAYQSDATEAGIRFFTYVSHPIKDVAAIVDQAALTLANDCGPAHIAQCMLKPFVGVFDAYKPEWFLKRDLAVCVLPELKSSGRIDVNDEMPGIGSITPQAVFGKVCRLITPEKLTMDTES